MSDKFKDFLDATKKADNFLGIEEQIKSIVKKEVARLYALSETGAGLDDKDVKKLESLSKLNELIKKSQPKKPKEEPTKEDLKDLLSQLENE